MMPAANSEFVAGMAIGVSLFIVNKQGSLVYQQDFFSTASNLSANDKIRLASTFHALSAIAVQTGPVSTSDANSNKPFGFLQPPGIVSLDANRFRIQCFPTITGLKILAVVPHGIHRDFSDILQQVFTPSD